MDDSEHTLLFVKTDHGMVPGSAEASEVFRHLPRDTQILVQFQVPRNPSHHRKWRALVDALHNAGCGESKKHLEDYIKIGCGWYDAHVDEEGNPVYIPRSTSFADMDQTRFNTFFKNVERFVSDRLLPDVEDHEARKSIMEFF